MLQVEILNLHFSLTRNSRLGRIVRNNKLEYYDCRVERGTRKQDSPVYKSVIADAGDAKRSSTTWKAVVVLNAALGLLLWFGYCTDYSAARLPTPSYSRTSVWFANDTNLSRAVSN